MQVLENCEVSGVQEVDISNVIGDMFEGLFDSISALELESLISVA